MYSRCVSSIALYAPVLLAYVVGRDGGGESRRGAGQPGYLASLLRRRIKKGELVRIVTLGNGGQGI
jgi:hypothetical protein